MFSPIMAIACVSSSATVRPVAGIRAAFSASRSPLAAGARAAIRRTSSWKLSLRATKSVSALTSTSAPRGAGQRPRRSGPRWRRGRPSWRPPPGPSCAASRPPPRCRRRPRASARLQSIMPAPVCSRSSLTSAAVISAMLSQSILVSGRASGSARPCGWAGCLGRHGGIAPRPPASPAAPRSRRRSSMLADVDARGRHLGLDAVEHRRHRPDRSRD